MEANLSKKWIPIVVGILNIINGLTILIIAGILSHYLLSAYWNDIYVTPFLFALAIIPALFAIISSIYAFKCKKLKLVLTATILVCVLLFPIWLWAMHYGGNLVIINIILAISAFLLLVLSREQFK